MKRIINKREYNTETAKRIRQYTYSFYGDPMGFEENLYQTPDGLYFLYVRGGEDSIHPGENIVRISKEKVNDWLKDHK